MHRLLSTGIEHVWPESKKLNVFTVRLQRPRHMRCEEKIVDISTSGFAAGGLLCHSSTATATAVVRAAATATAAAAAAGPTGHGSAAVMRYIKLSHLLGGHSLASWVWAPGRHSLACSSHP
jgi:hypothetical protein